MKTFDAAYWAQTAKNLNISMDVRHAKFAEFVADHCADRLRYVEGLGWYRWTGPFGNRPATTAQHFRP